MATDERKTRKGAEAVRWLLHHLTSTEFLSGDEFEAAGFGSDFGPPVGRSWRSAIELFYLLGNLRGANRGMPYRGSNIIVADGSISVRDPHGHVRELVVEIDGEGLIAEVDIRLRLAGGLVARPLDDRDFTEIEEMEAAAGISHDDGRCHIERRGSLRTALGLLGDSCVRVIEQGNRIVGVGGASWIPLRIGGAEPATFTYTHHYRIRHDARKLGLVRVLADACLAPLRGRSAGVAYVVHGANKRGVATLDFPWRAEGVRVILDCSEVGSDSDPETASSADAERVCRMINHAHSGQEWFVPYDANTLSERLERSPSHYGWKDLFISNKAVVGTWYSGEDRRYVVGDLQWSERRAVVLDYGFAEGGLTELETLLRCTASRALARGCTHLSIFSSPAAPAWPLLSRLSHRKEVYNVSCSVPEPGSSRLSGLYIDPILA